jgi:hypothetical protein
MSQSIGFVLANIPSAPTTAPTSDLAISYSTRFKIVYNTLSSDGGSPILTYSLELANELRGSFIP